MLILIDRNVRARSRDEGNNIDKNQAERVERNQDRSYQRRKDNLGNCGGSTGKMAQGEKKKSEVISPEQNWEAYYNQAHTALTDRIGQLRIILANTDSTDPSFVLTAFEAIRRSREIENMQHQRISKLETQVTDLLTCVKTLNDKIKKYESYEPTLDDLQEERRMRDRLP